MSEHIEKGLIFCSHTELAKGSLPLVEADDVLRFSENHIRVAVVPSTPSANNLCGSKNTYKWIVQVSIYTKKGLGSLAAADFIDEYRKLLPPHLVLEAEGNTYRVTKKGYLSTKQFKSSGWFVTPMDFIFEHNEE